MLTGTVETAVNALWDAAPLVGDRVTVVGAGMVGCCVAALLARLPRHRRSSWSTSDADRGRIAESLGVPFAIPTAAKQGRDLVFHASASSAGLQLSPEPARPRGHGDRAELVRRPRGQRARWAAPSTPDG